MRGFEWKYVPESGLVLLTMQDVHPDVPIQIADFRDTHALAFRPSGGFVGQSRSGMKLGRALKMVDGVWYMSDDVKSQQEYADFTLDPGALVLVVIP